MRRFDPLKFTGIKTEPARVKPCLLYTSDRAIIIFVTNYSEYACEGYCVNALRYIQKPVNEKVVFECLDIAYRQ